MKNLKSFLRAKVVSWLIRKHPHFYMKQKKLGHHRMGLNKEFLSVLAMLVECRESITSFRERYNLWTLVRGMQKLPGDLAEVGVYRGGSAMVLAAAKGTANLHLFDTFEGMPETNSKYDGVFSAGMFKNTGLEFVKNLLAPWTNVEFHQGFFPDTTKGLDPKIQFKFANIDVDIFESTLACLEYFYPRIVPGGVLVFHDYNAHDVPGTKIAVDEFMHNKPEMVLELWDTQALIVKQ